MLRKPTLSGAAAVLIAAATLGGAVAASIESSPLRQDKTFGNRGSAITRFSSGGKRVDSSANAVAVQKDGKIVVAGGKDQQGAGDRTQGGSDPADFALARYKSDGSLDKTFGIGGKVTSELTGKETIRALAIQPDGKIVAGGESCGRDPAGEGTPDECVFAVVRYKPNGSLDPSFGVAGVATTDIGYSARVAAIATTPKGEIVAVGSGEGGPPSKSPARPEGETAVVRYGPNGTLDNSFGDKGIKSLRLGVYNGSLNFGLVVQPDGKVVVAAAGDSASGVKAGADSRDFVLGRLNTDGSADDGEPGDSTPADKFGTKGQTSTDFGGSLDEVAGLAMQSDGKLVAVGTRQLKPKSEFALARYDSNGILDPSFGSAGKVITPSDKQGLAAGLVVRPGDSLVVAGIEGDEFSINQNRKFALAGYSKDGALLAPAEGESPGIVFTDVGGAPGGEDIAKDVALFPDGAIILAGESMKFGSKSPDFAVVRYGNPAPIPSETSDSGPGSNKKILYLAGAAVLLGIAAVVVIAKRRRA